MASDVHPMPRENPLMADDGDQANLLQNEYTQNVDTGSEIQPESNRNALGDAVFEDEQSADMKPYIISSGHYPGHDNYLLLNEPMMLAPRSSFHHVFVGAIVAGTSTVLTLFFPTYLTNFNAKSDAYCALMFCAVSCWVFLSLAAVGLKVCRRGLSLRPPLPLKRLVKIGIYYGLSGLAIFYGRDRYRVGCHLQDPLAAVLLPVTVICHLFSPKVDSVSKFVCIASAIIGLFICIDFQIWDEFSCHGNMISTSTGDSGNWSSDEHVIWTMVYLIGFGFLALFFNMLEWEIKGKICPNVASTIPMVSRDGAHNLALIEELQPSTSADAEMTSPVCAGLKSTTGTARLDFGQALVIAMWLQLVSAATILALFWTDLFSFFGKAGSSDGFQQMMSAGFTCVFGLGSSTDSSCHCVALIAWPFVILYSVLLVAVVYLICISSNCSSSYVVGVLTLGLPLSTLFWSFFVTGNVFRWAPSFSGETGFTVVGFPIMVVALVLYKYYSEREKVPVIEA